MTRFHPFNLAPRSLPLLSTILLPVCLLIIAQAPAQARTMVIEQFDADIQVLTDETSLSLKLFALDLWDRGTG